MAFLVGTAAAADSTPTTGGIDTTGGTLIVASVSYFNGASNDPPTMSDSKGNTWNQLTVYFGTTNCKIALYWCVPTSVGSGHTFTATATDAYATLCVAAFDDDFSASPFDLENGGGNTSTATQQPGSITPSQNNCLVVTGLTFGTGTNDTESVNESFTIAAQGGDGSSSFRGSIAYKYQTTAAAVNPTWTLNTTTQMTASIASFKTDAGGATVYHYFMLLGVGG